MAISLPKNSIAQNENFNLSPDFQSVSSVLFQIDLQRKDNGISSLLLIQPESETAYKLVFLTQFGLKLMEFKMVDGKMEKIDVIEWMDRKMALKILEKDFCFAIISKSKNTPF